MPRREIRSALLYVASFWVAIAGICGPIAHAQRGLNTAQRHFDAARFQEAIEAYDRAEQRDSFERDQLYDLYEGRARAKQATGDDAGARRDLLALLSLAPDRGLPPDVPPALLRLHDEVRAQIGGPLAIQGSAVPVPEGWVLTGEIRGDVARITARTRLRYDLGDGVWRTARGPEALVPLSDSIRFYMVAIGPGGAHLAEDGSEDDPHLVHRPGTVVDDHLDPDPDPNPDPPSRFGRREIILTSSIAGALLIAALVVIIAAPYGDDGTRPSRPMEIP